MKCALVERGFGEIASLPFRRSNLQERDVIFEGNEIKVRQRYISLHGLPKVLGGQIKVSQFRGFHFHAQLFLFLYLIHDGCINMIFKEFLYDCAYRKPTRNHTKAVKDISDSDSTLRLDERYRLPNCLCKFFP